MGIWQNPSGYRPPQARTNYLEIFWYRDQTPTSETAASLVTDLSRTGIKHLAPQSRFSTRSGELCREPWECVERRNSTRQEWCNPVFHKDPSGILIEFLEDNRGF